MFQVKSPLPEWYLIWLLASSSVLLVRGGIRSWITAKYRDDGYSQKNIGTGGVSLTSRGVRRSARSLGRRWILMHAPPLLSYTESGNIETFFQLSTSTSRFLRLGKKTLAVKNLKFPAKFRRFYLHKHRNCMERGSECKEQSEWLRSIQITILNWAQLCRLWPEFQSQSIK